MWIVIGCIITIIGLGMVYFHIPSSRLKKEFVTRFNEAMAENQSDGSILTKEDLKDLPECMQKFYEKIKVVGKEKQYSFAMYSMDTDFINGVENQKKLSIDYYEYAFVNKITYMAFINSSMYGIPFQGFDSYIDQKGGMKGVIAKNITIFNVQGKDMDKACLTTCLAEAVFLPAFFLEKDVILEELSDTCVKATFTYGEETATVEYRFNEENELVEIYALGRGLTMDDGSIKECPWSIWFDNYREQDGYYVPAVCQAVWHLEDKDLIYFDAKDAQLKMGVDKAFK